MNARQVQKDGRGPLNSGKNKERGLGKSGVVAGRVSARPSPFRGGETLHLPTEPEKKKDGRNLGKDTPQKLGYPPRAGSSN